MRLMQPIHKNKIPNIHTLQPHHNTLGTHNMHKRNTNSIHKPLEMRTTHAAPAQPTHPTNTTNQSLTISTQTINAPTDYTPGTSPREQATSPPTVGTPHADNTTTQLTRYQSTHTQHPSNCTSNQCIHNRYTPNCFHKQCTYT